MSQVLVTIRVHTVKAFTIDRATACPIMLREIATLHHELIRRLVGYRPFEVETRKWGYTIKKTKRTTYIGDNPMERTLGVSEPVLSRGELAKVLRRVGHHVIKQTEHDSASRFRVDRDVELVKSVISQACGAGKLWCARIRSPC